ncbi:MAG: Coenzyme F420 hydrogenase/dehydrogenase, beta subunit C-terminal domain [candidate division WOR-3 bacterium]
MKGLLKVADNNPAETLRTVYRRWLADGRLSALLVPARSRSGVVTLALVAQPEALTEAAPLLPCLHVNGAQVLADVGRDAGPDTAKVGAVLRPCELRAVVELAKLQQIALDNLVLIGIDCPGTFKVATYRKLLAQDPDFDNNFARKRDLANSELRTACQLCETPQPLVFDLAIGYIGLDPDRELWLEAATEKGDKLLEDITLEPQDEPADRRSALETLITRRREQIAERLTELDRAVLGPENLVRFFADCLNCHNCMKVCPICYCRECFFDSDVFRKDIAEHVRLTRRKGLRRMPRETLLFHLTRMNHMMTSCVQCGVCEDSCPAGIGLATLFKKVARNAQEEFGYLSGRSLEEPLPLTTFREDEFQRLGEE